MDKILPLLIVCGVGIVVCATYIILLLVEYYSNVDRVEYYELLEDNTLVIHDKYY